MTRHPAETPAVHIGTTAIARIAAHYTREVPGVVALQPDLPHYVITAARRLLDPRHDSPDGVDVDLGTDVRSAHVAIHVVTQLGFNCRSVAEAIQQQVAAQVLAHTGLTAHVAVTVTDVVLHEVRPPG